MRRCAAALAALSMLVVGCSSSDGSAPKNSSVAQTTAAPDGGNAAAAAVAPVARWWSNSAVKSGSKVDATNPGAAAAQLKPSRTDYCGMLRQTLAARGTILPGASASDPALASAATAFVDELAKVAPSEVAGAWQVLGKMIVTMVQSRGDPSALRGLDGSQIKSAVATVSADAKTRCGLDLSATAH